MGWKDQFYVCIVQIVKLDVSKPLEFIIWMFLNEAWGILIRQGVDFSWFI
jgi:hypothetical protein